MRIAEAQFNGLFFQMPDLSDDLAARQMAPIPAAMVRWLRREMEMIFEPLTAAKTAEEFRSLREQFLPKFVRLSAAAYSVVSAEVVSEVVSEAGGRLNVALSDLEEKFDSDRSVLAGADARQEAIECLRVFHQGLTKAMEIIRRQPPDERAGEYAALVQRALTLLFWSQLHLECIRFLIEHNRPTLSEAVLREILSGFRSAVPACAAAEEALEIDKPRTTGAAKKSVPAAINAKSQPVVTGLELDDEGDQADQDDARFIRQAEKGGRFISLRVFKRRMGRRS